MTDQPRSYDDFMCCGYPPEEAMFCALQRLPRDTREIRLTPRGFREFALGLGSMRGTVYPYADGGIRYAGPYCWVIVRPAYDGPGT